MVEKINRRAGCRNARDHPRCQIDQRLCMSGTGYLLPSFELPAVQGGLITRAAILLQSTRNRRANLLGKRARQSATDTPSTGTGAMILLTEERAGVREAAA